jgi:CRISPR-associated endonuclease Csn1
MGADRRKPYRLGLDLGSNSVGWFMVWLERDGEHWRPVALGPGGVRVFPDGRDPQSGTSNASDRRTARSARRRRDRFIDRRKKLMNALVKHRLMPADERKRKGLEALDPYELRAKALDTVLPAYHVGRALFHLNQRRGFLSNRKAEKNDDDKGAIKQGASRLKQRMQEEKVRTLGEFLWRRHQRRDPVRARNRSTGTKAEYDFYPTRDLYQAEFDAIWNAQAKHHPSMTPEARKEIGDTIIFYQRELKQPPVGKCSLDPATEAYEKDPEGYRCPWAHPLAQRFRILKEVRNLEIRETGKASRKLSKEEGDKIVLALLQSNKVSFDKIRALLKLPPEARFNLESERRDHLKGDELAEKLASKKLFGKAWRSLPLDRQVTIAEKLLNEADEKALVLWLENECGLDASRAEQVADAPLPEGHCRLGLRALKKMLPIMADGFTSDGRSGVQEHEAAARAGYDHAKLPSGEILDRLPYYGRWMPDAVVGSGDARAKKEKRFGQFPNPTVHIGLGQLRRLVNAIIKQWGPPEQIVVELARNLKQTQDEKNAEEARQAKNQKKNDERKAKLAEIGIANVSGADLLKIRLWEELGDLVKLCPFSGRPISLNQLMSHEVEVEHLIPFADSLDNSPANKTVCFASIVSQRVV